jgi:hypothetical protein
MDQNPELVIPGGRKRDAIPSDYDLVHTNLELWSIPTDNDLDAFFNVSMDPPSGKWEHPTMCSYRGWWASSDYGKYRFSAATAAIYFLRSRPLKLRLQLRNVLIHEDHCSVAFPGRHAIGLIPFCQENPALQLMRQVSVWRTLSHCPSSPWNSFEALWNEIPVRTLTSNIAEWMIEAGALPSLGMPAGQFVLLLDGNPAPEQIAKFFGNVVQTVGCPASHCEGSTATR